MNRADPSDLSRQLPYFAAARLGDRPCSFERITVVQSIQPLDAPDPAHSIQPVDAVLPHDTHPFPGK